MSLRTRSSPRGGSVTSMTSMSTFNAFGLGWGMPNMSLKTGDARERTSFELESRGSWENLGL